MWNRGEFPPWKAIGVNYSYHLCVILLHNRRLFGFVKRLAEFKSLDSSVVGSTELSLDLITLESIDMAFQSCRSSAEHICVITKCILDSITSTRNSKNVFPGYTIQALFYASLVLVMLIASRYSRFIHCQQWSPNGIWDSEIDGDTVQQYFEWLNMALEVIDANMTMDGARRMHIKELERLLRTLKRGEVVRRAAVEASKAGVSVEKNVAAAAATLTAPSHVNLEEEDHIVALSDDLKSLLMLERLRDIRNHTNAIADVVEKSAVASIRSVSVSTSIATSSVSPAISIGGGSSALGKEGITTTGHIDERVTSQPTFYSEHDGGSREGLVGVELSNNQAGANAMMGTDGDFGLSNVASTVEGFLDLLSMDWSGEDGQSDTIPVQRMGFNESGF
ncbi:hypothetical protein HDU76_008407 [Blyttiomyces sp. JEL0837]|nr:hypothetical protein HDU76_008407 [Blyttiomyces sp. JEL0837]